MSEQPKKTSVKLQTIGWLDKAIDLVGYPIAAFIGYKAATLAIRKSLYKNYASAGGVRDIQGEHKKELLESFSSAIKTGNAHAPEAWEAANESYRAALKERFHEAGFNGISKMWRGIHPNQRWDAIAYAAGAAGVSLGVMLTLANNISLAKQLEWLEENNKSAEPDKNAGIGI